MMALTLSKLNQFSKFLLPLERGVTCKQNSYNIPQSHPRGVGRSRCRESFYFLSLVSHSHRAPPIAFVSPFYPLPSLPLPWRSAVSSPSGSGSKPRPKTNLVHWYPESLMAIILSILKCSFTANRSKFSSNEHTKWK